LYEIVQTAVMEFRSHPTLLRKRGTELVKIKKCNKADISLTDFNTEFQLVYLSLLSLLRKKS